MCEQYERTVSADNCVHFEGLILRIPADRHRCHYVKAKVRVHRYTNGDLAVFHGPRKLAEYSQGEKMLTQNLKQAVGYALHRFPTKAEKADNSCATEPDISKNPRQALII